jgi:hypothetical protein
MTEFQLFIFRLSHYRKLSHHRAERARVAFAVDVVQRSAPLAG